jgi:hypothetical protein
MDLSSRDLSFRNAGDRRRERSRDVVRRSRDRDQLHNEDHRRHLVQFGRGKRHVAFFGGDVCVGIGRFQIPT